MNDIEHDATAPGGPPGGGRRGSPTRTLLRDMLILHLKLALDGLKDLAIVQLSVGAVVLDLLLRRRRPRYFYTVLRWAERFDLWLNLYAPTDGVRENDDGLFGSSPAGGNSLLGKLEEWARQTVEEPVASGS